ncbi:hypothetical protein GPALN_013159 [Globodera pallida]|nr:hypothetical protein GPALN_013159 [Globodera pallida]
MGTQYAVLCSRMGPICTFCEPLCSSTECILSNRWPSTCTPFTNNKTNGINANFKQFHPFFVGSHTVMFWFITIVLLILFTFLVAVRLSLQSDCLLTPLRSLGKPNAMRVQSICWLQPQLDPSVPPIGFGKWNSVGGTLAVASDWKRRQRGIDLLMGRLAEKFKCPEEPEPQWIVEKMNDIGHKALLVAGTCRLVVAGVTRLSHRTHAAAAGDKPNLSQLPHHRRMLRSNGSFNPILFGAQSELMCHGVAKLVVKQRTIGPNRAKHQRTQRNGQHVDAQQAELQLKNDPAESALLCYQRGGQRHFGENYVQELETKAHQLALKGAKKFDGITLGGSNRIWLIRRLCAVPNLWCVETVDSAKHADAVQRAIKARVNTSGEPNKRGVRPDQLLSLAKHITVQCQHLSLIGLMSIGAIAQSFGGGEENEDFVLLRRLRDELQVQLRLPNMLELSMGMSADYHLDFILPLPRPHQLHPEVAIGNLRLFDGMDDDSVVDFRALRWQLLSRCAILVWCTTKRSFCWWWRRTPSFSGSSTNNSCQIPMWHSAHGVEIFLTYKYGSSRSIVEAGAFHLPRLRWLGFLTFEAQRLPIPSNQCLQLSEKGRKRIERIAQRTNGHGEEERSLFNYETFVGYAEQLAEVGAGSVVFHLGKLSEHCLNDDFGEFITILKKALKYPLFFKILVANNGGFNNTSDNDVLPRSLSDWFPSDDAQQQQRQKPASTAIQQQQKPWSRFPDWNPAPEWAERMRGGKQQLRLYSPMDQWKQMKASVKSRCSDGGQSNTEISLCERVWSPSEEVLLYGCFAVVYTAGETNAAAGETNAAAGETNAAAGETNAAAGETNAAAGETNAAAGDADEEGMAHHRSVRAAAEANGTTEGRGTRGSSGWSSGGGEGWSIDMGQDMDGHFGQPNSACHSGGVGGGAAEDRNVYDGTAQKNAHKFHWTVISPLGGCSSSPKLCPSIFC